MTFLIWTNQQDAETSLSEINALYGCPYVAENGYRMDQWAFISKSAVSNNWGFFSPERSIMDYLVPGYTETEMRPEDWILPPEADGSL